ncbi:GNAT family N-acetyltransferase [Janibacter corallicola]|uniref:GNAT family N-acetyltransferase n=1 Tax=Janibacter corallicola TaxID=415212 RepID=UPI0008335661|nr:GNAT family N-acetyltransferase [Janibacter corallicola]
MMPTRLPRILRPPALLRPFADIDADLVRSIADDPLIPLITTVPTSGTRGDALSYIERQHARLRDGQGYSFVIADAVQGHAVGQIGLWTRDINAGRASTGYWVAPQFRRRGYLRAALAGLTEWALTHDEISRIELHVEPWNAGSWRAARACGYEREGRLRSWEQVGEERKDMDVWSVVSHPSERFEVPGGE